MTFGVPAYFHPAREAADWARLRAARRAVAVVVINPDSGPGRGDPEYRAAARRATGLVAGYVDTAYAARPLRDVLAEAAAYRRWYGVAAVFADRVTADARHLGYYRALARRLHGALLLNPGVRPAPGYLDIAEVVVTFEGNGAAHRDLAGPDPRGRARTWHLVHGVPTAEHAATVRRAGHLGAAHAYVTDRVEPNPWDGLPASWTTG